MRSRRGDPEEISRVVSESMYEFRERNSLRGEGCEDPNFYFTYFYFILLAYLIIYLSVYSE